MIFHANAWTLESKIKTGFQVRLVNSLQAVKTYNAPLSRSIDICDAGVTGATRVSL